MITWPEFEKRIRLDHNQHKTYYETVSQSLKSYNKYVWLNDEDMTLCIKNDDFWTMNVDNNAFASSSLKGVLELAGGSLDDSQLLLPEYAISLHISVDREADEDFLDSVIYDDDWVSTEQQELALSNKIMWSMQWYPTTPIGSYCVMAASFEKLLEEI